MFKRLLFRELQEKAPDSIREIEMAVDAAAYERGVSIQFWADVRSYGLREACLYLRGYAHDKLADVSKVEAVCTMCDAIIARLNNQLRPAPQPEGNGWDSVETSTD